MMKGILSLLTVCVVGLLAFFGLTGCSGNQVASPAGPATVRLVLADSRAATPTSLSSLVFKSVDLLSGTANPTAPSVQDWQLTSGLINPNFPIPLLGSPSTIPPYNGQTPNAPQILAAIVPPGTYQTLRLQLDSSFSGSLADLNLPFNPNTLQTIVPIIGGLKLNPNQSVTLLVDLVKNQAQVL